MVIFNVYTTNGRDVIKGVGVLECFEGCRNKDTRVVLRWYFGG